MADLDRLEIRLNNVSEMEVYIPEQESIDKAIK